ncbi:MAG TPA: hypothetical protein VGA02_05735 [Gemmatimonadales bacterium]
MLATATQGECTRPTPEVVADAWVDQDQGHEKYFFENVRNGIRTADDQMIWARMLERRPPWLARSAYATAQQMLASELKTGA